jgi:hypothetical protein
VTPGTDRSVGLDELGSFEQTGHDVADPMAGQAGRVQSFFRERT